MALTRAVVDAVIGLGYSLGVTPVSRLIHANAFPSGKAFLVCYPTISHNPLSASQQAMIPSPHRASFLEANYRNNSSVEQRLQRV